MLAPKVAKRLHRTPSTNVALREAIERGEDLPAGAIYITDDQTDGQGQGSNRWHSSPGANLTFSLLLRPDHLAVDRLFALTQAASLAVHEAVQDFLPDTLRPELTIKWPNDLYAGDRKLGGILIQNGLRGAYVQWSVVGIGLNINEVAFPPPLDRTAISLRQWIKAPVDREKLLTRFTESMTKYDAWLGAAAFGRLQEAYLDRLYRLHTDVAFASQTDGARFHATVLGVDYNGHLRLRHTNDGRERTYELRSLRWLI